MVHIRKRFQFVIRKWDSWTKKSPSSASSVTSPTSSVTPSSEQLSRSESIVSTSPALEPPVLIQEPDAPQEPAFQFTHLPWELQMEIVDLLFHQSSDAFKSLRLANRHLNTICGSFMFHEIDLNEMNMDRLDEILANLDRLVPHIRSLKLWVPNSNEGGLEGASAQWEHKLITLLEKTFNIQSLTLYHDRYDKRGQHSLLLHTIAGLPSLRHVTIQEHTYSRYLDIVYGDVPQNEASTFFFHELLMTLSLCHGQRLESLNILTLLPMHPTAFTRIRDHLPRLHSLHFTTNITFAIRDLFSENKRWACADTLKNLTLHECGGTHMVTIANHVHNGNFGELDQLNVVACGDPSDEVPSRAVLEEMASEVTLQSKCTVPPIQTLCIDHAAEWELRVLASIPAKKLALTRAPVETILEFDNILRERFGFSRYLSELAIQSTPTMQGSEAQTMLETCASRSIHVCSDAPSWGYCLCHPDA